MPATQIDSFVRDFLKKERTHTFDWVTIDDAKVEVCKECGKRKDDVRLPNSTYQFLPCRGMVG